MSRPNWDSYYFNIALAVADRATCLRRKYGAVIVKDHAIVSTGYCGAPVGEVNCCDKGTCKRQELNVPPGERYELCVSVHAEMNAIIRANRADMQGATIYVAGRNAVSGEIVDSRPCLLCRRMIKNAEISRVVCWAPPGDHIYL